VQKNVPYWSIGMKMKIFFLIFTLIATPALSDNSFLSIYNSDDKCELRLHGKEGGYFGTPQKQGVTPVKGQGCNIVFSATEFEGKYDFCALSGVSMHENERIINCNFYQSEKGEYIFFASPGVKACKYVCLKK
jgi:hypothetical protein